jgi:hypothetical protein
MQFFSVSSAYLCQDCNVIGNCATQCPACASRVLLGIAAVLDREPEQKMQPKSSWVPALVAYPASHSIASHGARFLQKQERIHRRAARAM